MFGFREVSMVVMNHFERASVVFDTLLVTYSSGSASPFRLASWSASTQ